MTPEELANIRVYETANRSVVHITTSTVQYDSIFANRYREGMTKTDYWSAMFDDVMLLRDPEERDLYVARFTQTTKSDHGSVTLRKRLYWRRGDAGWKIVTEDAG